MLLILNDHVFGAESEMKNSNDKRMDWWREARFGMFIHWGLYAIPAGEWETGTNHAEWIRTTAEIPLEQYDKFVEDFNPVNFNADDWVRMAKDAGMKYIVITSKHHDGFSLFNSKYTEYDVMATLCEIIGHHLPAQTDGISFLPVLINKDQVKKHEYHYWESHAYNGQQAVRMGKWKGIRKDIFDHNLNIELFDLDKDKQEQNNLAAKFPDVIKKIEIIMQKEHIPAILDRFKIAQLGDY